MRRTVEFERLHNFPGSRWKPRPATAVRSTLAGSTGPSDTLSKLRGDDWHRFLALGVRTVIDLRYPWEIEANGRVPDHPGLSYHNLNIEHRPYDQAALCPNVEPVRFLADRYAEVALDGVEELRQAVELIVDPRTAPVVVHCTSGNDRTGIAAALVLALLGVAEDGIVADFALTGQATERPAAAWRAANPYRQLLWPGYGKAPPDLMRTFLAELAARHGSVHAYVTDQLDVDCGVIAGLRAHLFTR